MRSSERRPCSPYAGSANRGSTRPAPAPVPHFQFPQNSRSSQIPTTRCLCWETSANATYSSITIASGATLTATTGKSLTMTVNGIETPISSGTYTGTVVLHLLLQYPQLHKAALSLASIPLTGTAVYVNISGAYDSAVIPVAAAVPEGTVYANHADNVHVTSVGPNFSAFIITGGTYTINNPVIRLTGNALNDFVGHGFAIKSAGSSTTYINNADILNKGVVRGAIWVEIPARHTSINPILLCRTEHCRVQ